MGLFDKIREPVFLKEDSEAVRQLEQLERLRGEIPASLQDRLEDEIRIVKAGIRGEQAVDYELRNSHLPIVVLHDLFLTQGDLSAQIDYLIVTCKAILVVECKNMVGDMEITRAGDFIRTFQYGKAVKKEGIYSPVTQNKRHLALIKELHHGNAKNPIYRALLDKSFYSAFRSVIVLANPHAVLKDRYAPKEIRDQVIRVDHLAEYIHGVINGPDTAFLREKELTAYARKFLDLHQDNPVDYTEKYRKMIRQAQENDEPTKREPDMLLCPRCGAPMVKRQAKQGAYAGKTFYGCSNYPRCKCIVNTE